MSKKALVITSAIAIALAFHACTLPSSVIIKGKPQLALPAKVNYEDFNFLIIDALKDAVKDIEHLDISILNYTGYYTSDKKNIQAFLMHFPVLQDYDLGLRDEMEQIKNFKFDLPAEDLSQEFDIGNMGDFNDTIAPVDFEADLSSLFNNLRDEINDGFNEEENKLSIQIPITGAQFEEDGPEFGGQVLSLSVLNILSFGKGKLYITLEIPDDEQNLPGVDITFKNLRISDNIHDDLNDDIMGIDVYSGTSEVQLTESCPKKTIVFDLEGKTLHSNIGLYIQFKKDDSQIGLYPPYQIGRLVTLNIIPEKMEDIKFRGIVGLNTQPFSVNLGDHIIDDNNIIDLNFPDGDVDFVHAEIDKGSLGFELIFPPVHDGTGSNSWMIGFEAIPALKLLQDHSVDVDGTEWPGINDSDGLLPTTPDPWDYNGTSNSLKGKHLNTNPIVIHEASGISLKAVDATFWLNDEDMESEIIAVSIQPKIDIESFKYVHFEIGDEINNIKPSIPPFRLEEATKYIYSFTFNEIGPKFTFGQVDVPGIEIMLSVPELGINPDGSEYKLIQPGGTIDFINDTHGFELTLKNSDGKAQVTELHIDFDIRPQGNKKVLEIPNLILSNTKLKFEISKVDFIFNWHHAIIDMGSLEDYFPKPDDNPNTIDLSVINQYLKGFLFDAVDVFLYASGPTTLFEFILDNNMDIEFNMNYTDSNGDSVGANILDDDFWDDFSLATHEPFELDPDNTGTYSGEIPPGGIPIKIIQSILKKEPVDVQFHYKIKAKDGLYITPETLNIIDFDKNIGMEILFVIPLLLTAGPDGADIILPNDELFEGKNDMFDRDNSANPLPLDFIKSLSLKVVLNSKIFSGGNLYLDDGHKRIELPLAGNALGLSVSGADLEYINSTIPYLPEIGISFSSGDRIQIERNLGTIKIDFKAEIEYELKFDDLDF